MNKTPCRSNHRPFRSGLLSCLLIGLAALNGAEAASRPDLKIDRAPVRPGGPATVTYAPAIEAASPSVVYIHTSQKIERPTTQDMPPFFNDPFFRRFFGEPQASPAPRERIPERREGLGSGVIISKDGYILTNNHVVEGADEIEVNVEKKKYPAKVIGRDPQTDVALIKIDAAHLPAITLTDSDNLKVGDVVLAIGNPFGVGKTVTMGIVSATGRSSLHLADYENFIQTDAAINPGNSGGALVDSQGRLVGINTAIISGSGGNQGIGFAIPINLARSVMDNLLSHGKVVRGYLGVMIQDVTPELAEAFGLKENRGALIGEVQPDTPAARAGLKAGDVVVAMNGRSVEDSSKFRLRVSQTAPGSRVRLSIIRDGRPMEVTVKLDELSDQKRAASGGIGAGHGGSDLLNGVQVGDLDGKARQQFQIPERVEGAIVLDVAPDSPAERGGLRVGDVIQSINHRPVKDSAAAIQLSRQLKDNRVLLRVWSRGGSHYLVIKKNKK